MIVRRALLALWFVLLLLPLATVLPLANGWKAVPWHIALASIWMASCAFVFLPRRLFLILTYPLLLAGIVIVAADLLRSASLLELLSVRYTFNHGEIADAVMPYVGYLAVTAAALLALLALLWRENARRSTLIWTQALVVLAGSGLVFALDKDSWRNAWPTVLVEPLIEGHIGDGGLGLPSMADVRVSPRDRFESWQASRESASGASETYVLVIGESVRSDRLAACGGRSQISTPPEGSVVLCDMLSGSSSTHTSVPLLVSRNLPGTRNRVPRDATMLKAFEAVGFETFWLSAQERSIAWPDAKNQAYEPAPPLDRDALLPLLDQALARRSLSKLIILHANNAHAPYLRRYREASAPFPVDANKIRGGVPTKQTLDEWWNAYDNAVDESMQFLQEVIARVHAQPGMSVVVFTPDHGENMLDDARGLTQHALKMPTLWDTAVPAIVWTNAAWRDFNADKWRMLIANRNAPLMHMDIAPTMLGAAGIRYLDQRTEPVDLTARPVPPRARYTQVRAGETVTLDILRQQAQVR